MNKSLVATNIQISNRVMFDNPVTEGVLEQELNIFVINNIQAQHGI